MTNDAPAKRLFRARHLAWVLLTAPAVVVAGWIVVDTLRAVVPLWSPLPWFDEWATVGLIEAWRSGTMTALEVLFAQHNEHRLVVPRLVFFADDLFFHGEGYLSLVAIFIVQAAHAALFAAVLSRSSPPRSGRWAVAAVVVALMFSLRQAENFSSGFQVQFVGVFAGATLSFVLFALVIGRIRRGAPYTGPLVASFGTVMLTSFTMANGLVSAFVLVAMALAARLRWPIVLACAAWAVLLALVYFQGYEPVAHHSRPSESLRHPVELLLYVGTYLGSVVASDQIAAPATAGLAGLGALLAAVVRTVRQRGARPAEIALVAVMLFVTAAALVTASGRLGFGIGQALSSRYVTGSVTFWAAQLVYWWIDPPAWPSRRVGRSAARTAVVLTGSLLLLVLIDEQRRGKGPLALQSFAQAQSADLLILGLDDPAVIGRAAWSDDDVRRLLPVLKDDRLSIFATADFESLGHPVVDSGTLVAPDRCGGAIDAAIADPTLGQDGLRLSGTAWDGPGRRLVRRLLLADAAGHVVGFGSGAVPGAGRSEWRGFAVAPVGARLTAFAILPGRTLCRVGDDTVAAGIAQNTSSDH